VHYDIPVFEPPVKRWECSHCAFRDVTTQLEPHTRFHACPGMGGMTTPMVEEGSGARTVAVAREDYVGREHVQMADDGRVLTSISTEYPDGRNDLVVFAPTASTSANA